jgi:hypothetical protein
VPMASIGASVRFVPAPGLILSIVIEHHLARRSRTIVTEHAAH